MFGHSFHLTNSLFKFIIFSYLIIFAEQTFAFDPGSPLKGVDPILDKRITSVFDRTIITNGVIPDKIVKAYTGEEGEEQYTDKETNCYQKEGGGPFLLNGNYIGAEGINYLCYDSHAGVDFDTDDDGDEVVAIDDGDVTVVVNTSPDTPDTSCKCYGNFIEITHYNGYKSRYAHLKGGANLTLRKGNKVLKGDKIAISGNSGHSFGSHLHLDLVDNNGRYVDPFDFWSPPAPSTKFSLNDKIEVTKEAGLIGVNVRATPDGKIEGMQPTGAVGVIESGPEYRNGYWRWLVRFNQGVSGWVAESWLAEYKPTVRISKLNDTGIITCSNSNANGLKCPVTGFPGQDAQYGRDAEAKAGTLQKIGGGEAGFDFTKLDSNGNPLAASANRWSCVRDNVTGLTWEVKTTNGLHGRGNTYSWYELDNTKNGGIAGFKNRGNCVGSSCDTYSYKAAVNAQRFCGATDWRLPSRAELLSIVNNAKNPRIEPIIDTKYFPNLFYSYGEYQTYGKYWTSSTWVAFTEFAVAVDFDFVVFVNDFKFSEAQVILVSNGL